MPRYLGPYDVVVIDGKEYQRGDNVNVAQARLEQLRSIERYRFEGDEVSVSPAVMANAPDEAHAPNEFGVPQDPNPRSGAAKAQAAAAVPSELSTGA